MHLMLNIPTSYRDVINCLLIY